MVETMKKSLILVILLVVLAITMGGCATSSPAATPTAPAITPTPSAITPTAPAATPTPPAASPTPGAPSTAAVSIAGLAFNPGEVTIAKGGTVTWTNDENLAHTVKFAEGESPTLAAGNTYSKKFEAAGTFTYGCGIHPAMKGTVTVV